MTSCYIRQLSFSFYRHRSLRVDFSGGQITSDAGLLPVRAFDERYSLTRRLAELLDDPREEERVRHSALSLFRQRIYLTWWLLSAMELDGCIAESRNGRHHTESHQPSPHSRPRAAHASGRPETSVGGAALLRH
jgi:hypothetical protein